MLIVFVVTYALSPIDLIPDFIPLFGLLDELILLPIALYLIMRMIPSHLMREFREQAMMHETLPKSWLAAGFVVVIWLLAFAVVVAWLFGGEH